MEPTVTTSMSVARLAEELGVDPERLARAFTVVVREAHPQATMTSAEEAVYRRVGGLSDPADADAWAAAAARWEHDIASWASDGPTVAEAAAKLGVSVTRINQRVQERSLLAVQSGGKRRLPGFQFTVAGEVPGWSEVAPTLPQEWTIPQVVGFMTTPQPELSLNGTPCTPLHWLSAGLTPEWVIALARDAAIPL